MPEGYRGGGVPFPAPNREMTQTSMDGAVASAKIVVHQLSHENPPPGYRRVWASDCEICAAAGFPFPIEALEVE